LSTCHRVDNTVVINIELLILYVGKVILKGTSDRSIGILQLYLCRYKSEGHIAGHGFWNPNFIEGEWYVFDEMTFGHLWKQLENFSLYSRVEETFAIQLWPTATSDKGTY